MDSFPQELINVIIDNITEHSLCPCSPVNCCAAEANNVPSRTSLSASHRNWMALRPVFASFSSRTFYGGMNLCFSAAHFTRRTWEGNYHPRAYLPSVHPRNNIATRPLALQSEEAGCLGYHTRVRRATFDMTRYVTRGPLERRCNYVEA